MKRMTRLVQILVILLMGLSLQAMAADLPLFSKDEFPKTADVQEFIKSELKASKITIKNYKESSTTDPKDVVYNMKYRSMEFSVVKDGKTTDFTCEVSNNTAGKTFLLENCISPSGTTYQSLHSLSEQGCCDTGLFNYQAKYFPASNKKNKDIVYKAAQNLVHFSDYQCGKDNIPALNFPPQGANIYKIKLQAKAITISRLQDAENKLIDVADIDKEDSIIPRFGSSVGEKLDDVADAKDLTDADKAHVDSAMTYSETLRSAGQVLSKCCAGEKDFCPTTSENSSKPKVKSGKDAGSI